MPITVRNPKRIATTMEQHTKEIWLVTGSQHLYGPPTLRQVAANSKAIARGLQASGAIPIPVTFKPVVTTPGEITRVCREANNDDACIGLIAWMHTFSPAKMWIGGLETLRKPLCHLHTQFNAEIPWGEIDMDFMNLNQSAHGDREFGHLLTRMRKNRKVVAGHWKNPRVQQQLGVWARVALGCDDMRRLKVARFGDNMRQVAVTEERGSEGHSAELETQDVHLGCADQLGLFPFSIHYQ